MAASLNSAYVPRNQLLAALPAEDLAQLRPRLESVKLGLRQIIQAPDEPIKAVYFPESGWISMLALLVDGNSAEVGIVGFEGMVGLPLLLGSDRSPTEAMVQAPGTFLRLNANAFEEELADGDEFPMTHEFMAMMLCVNRPGVTVAARLFQQAGLIRYSNGQITVIDRAGLEAAACECHGVVAREFERLLGPVRR